MTDCYELTYRVQPASPETHQFAVEITLPCPPARELTLALPAWTPGSYLIRDFARHIVALEAEDATGRNVPEKRDKQTWRLPAPQGAARVRYRVFAWDLSVRTAHLDATHGFFDGAGLFLRVLGLDQVPCKVELVPPTGDVYRDWRVATSLRRLDARPFAFGTYHAADYRDLIDHPVEMGRFRLIPFQVKDVPHWMAITGRQDTDETRLGDDLARICAQHAELFGELPIDRYLFLTTAVGNGYGGLEHGHSASLLCRREDLPRRNAMPDADGYARFLGLCSHEYFHLWHVKRIRPQALAATDLAQEAYTRDLWAYEGITSYYDDLALVRSGCIDGRAYLGRLARTITGVMRTPGRHRQTLADSSFDAWIKLYKADENSPNALVSYYDKGALVALALDLTIRRRSAQRRSLDDLMRSLWETHGRTRLAVPEQGIEALAAAIAGEDLRGFFDQALRSTADLDLADLLDDVGIAMRLRPARGPKDEGGLVERFDDQPAPATLGLRWQALGMDIVVRNVLSGSPAEAAGLAPGDALVAIDGLRVTRDTVETLLAQLAVDAEIALHAFRRDELMIFSVRPGTAPADTCELRIMTEAPADATHRRAAWLGQSA